MPGLFTRRHFTFGLAAAAIPLASRLPFGQANAVETATREAPIAPVIPKTFTAFGGVRIDNYDWLRDRKDPPRLGDDRREQKVRDQIRWNAEDTGSASCFIWFEMCR
jgi:hypothetical protein